SSFSREASGIRDKLVTGVQTCALPISPRTASDVGAGARIERATSRDGGASRSEERRVGKECRSRGSPYHLKKKMINFWPLPAAAPSRRHRALLLRYCGDR